MRQFINKFGVPLAVVIIVLAAILAIFSRKSGTIPAIVGDPSLAWYIDESTGEESVLVFRDNIPPFKGAGGGTLVMACKFQADCEKEPITGYLLKYTEDVRQRGAAFTGDNDQLTELLSTGRLVRSLEPGSPWVSIYSSRAEEITSVPAHSSGQPRRWVYPKQR